MLNKNKTYLIAAFFSFLITLSFSSCESKNDCTAIIVVKDFENNSISGAQVTLHQDSIVSDQGSWSNQSNLRKTEETDANGRAEFSYQLEAILNIEVFHVSGKDTLTGKNVIRLLQGKTETKIVTIN